MQEESDTLLHDTTSHAQYFLPKLKTVAIMIPRKHESNLIGEKEKNGHKM